MTNEADYITRPLWVKLVLLGLSLVIFITLIGLGNWQMRRLAWKNDLIDAVNARAVDDPVELPNGTLTADAHAYLKVELSGKYRHDLSRRVKAVTELGPGHWLMVPLLTREKTVWINRGFLPSGLTDAEITEPEGDIRVTGLLRMTEPEGTALESNDPEADRWVSRDIEALSRAAGVLALNQAFVDAYHTGVPDAWPRGGLTIISFRNNHLSYALTWYTMAALLLCGMAYVIYDHWRPNKLEKEA
ncbi:MAG: SURF1 family protein [Pseudomonadota bacterium]